MAGAGSDSKPLESREPSAQDLAQLCGWLNDVGARYVVLGGFAMRAAGYDRRTMDIDILVDATPENEAKVIAAVSRLAATFRRIVERHVRV
jgi:predicted nucleotidyltransferase